VNRGGRQRSETEEGAEEGTEGAGLHRGAAENAEFRRDFFLTLLIGSFVVTGTFAVRGG
jgi:hypothetical protein